MRVLLVQPPQSDPAQPYSSLAVLLAAWRHAGLDVGVADLNLEFYNYLLRPEVLLESLSDVEARLATGKLRDEHEKKLLHQSVATGSWLVPSAARALGTMKHPAEFYDPDRYAWALRTLKRALGVHSSTAYPGHIGMQSFETADSYLSSRGILAATQDAASNLFLRHCDAVARGRIVGAEPDIIAVSVTFQSQIIPAFTLAAQLRKWLPDVKVVFGGATITRIREVLPRTPHLFRDEDAYILFEGETALPALVDEWVSGRSGLEAPNVMLLEGGEVKTARTIHTEDLNSSPPPDHSGLPLRDYWIPAPALLINSSRGCYYGRCTFCMISPATWGPQRMGKSYRLRATERVVEDIRYVNAQTGAVAFNLANDILPPRALYEIGDALASTGLDVTWDSEIRLERGLSRRILGRMHEGGCRHLRFGFETASPRVAELMEKGTDLEVTKRILADCKEVGITVCLLTQVAFPGESTDEAAQTLGFLQEHATEIAFVSLTQFVLETGSGVYRNPGRYGITMLPNPADEDLSWMYFFDREDGITPTDSAQRYSDMEEELDRVYPDRDLFFKGGLGHAHTTLYTGRYAPERFITWNRSRFRTVETPSEDRLIQTSPNLAMWQYPPKAGSTWSEFAASAAEMPEYVARLDGGLLLFLAAGLQPIRTGEMVEAVARVSRDRYDHRGARDLVEGLFEAGFFLDANGDKRQLDPVRVQ